MIFKNSKWYDFLKYFALIFIPALVVLLNTIGQIWNLQNIPQITATIAAFGVFLGGLLQISSAKYNKEQQIEPPDEEETIEKP